VILKIRYSNKNKLALIKNLIKKQEIMQYLIEIQAVWELFVGDELKNYCQPFSLLLFAKKLCIHVDTIAIVAINNIQYDIIDKINLFFAQKIIEQLVILPVISKQVL
jgi:hypothetical protein